MTKIGTKKIRLTYSRRTIDRIVWKDAAGKYYTTWGGQMIEVEQVFGFEDETAGWHTVEAY